MSRLEKLIQKLCPDGVGYKTISSISTVGRGKRVVKNQLTGTGKYPVFQNSLNPLGYYTESNLPGNTTFIIGAGAAGEIGYSEVDFWAADDCYFIEKNETIDDRFLYHVLLSQQQNIFSKVRKASIPRLSRSVIENLVIPVPPLEVQSEIVRILDNFTELTAELIAELTAELTARKQQYEYYRDKLLTPDINAKWRTIGEVSSFRRGSFPQPYGNKDWYDGVGAMPFIQVADIGDDLRLVKDTKRKISVLAQPKSVFAPVGSVVISLQGSIGRVAITQYDAYIDRTVALFYDISSEVLPQYFVYQIQRVFSIKEKTARGSTIKTITKEEFANFQIPVPSLLIQKKIVGILDNFDAICSDLSTGLPAEIEARQKQYEYYRDKLLTFKEISA